MVGLIFSNIDETFRKLLIEQYWYPITLQILHFPLKNPWYKGFWIWVFDIRIEIGVFEIQIQIGVFEIQIQIRVFETQILRNWMIDF